VEHLEDLREPRALPGWIVTTTRNEALRILSARRRVEPVDPQVDARLDAINKQELVANLLLAERRQAVHGGLAKLQACATRPVDAAIRRSCDLLPTDQPAARHAHRKHRTHPLAVPAKLKDTTNVRALAS
jgi:hypothetical protein